jgi:tripartite-type tricarboxylate transporter receptor subunit TctC
MIAIPRRSLLAAPLAMPALAQAPWPQRSIALMVPYPPGGSTDNTARPVSQKLSEVLGQNVVIENRGGAGGTIGAAQVAVAKPDGYTFLCFPTAVMTISPHMMRVPYDPARDLEPLAMLSVSDGVMAMHPSVPLRDMAAVIAYAKANPGKLRFSSAGNGTITQLIPEIFASNAGIRIEHVPYRGSAPALTAVMAGDVELQFDPVAIPAVKDGRLRGIATLGEERSNQLPELPTLTELGLFNGGAYSWFGLAAPAGLPPEINARLVQALRVVLADPAVARAMAPVGLRPSLEHGAAFARRVEQDRATFGEAVRRTGAKAE